MNSGFPRIYFNINECVRIVEVFVKRGSNLNVKLDRFGALPTRVNCDLPHMTHRRTDRSTDRQTDRQRDIQEDRQTDQQPASQTDRQTDSTPRESRWGLTDS